MATFLNSVIEVICPCGKHLTIRMDVEYKTTRCWKCSRSITVHLFAGRNGAVAHATDGIYPEVECRCIMLGQS